jgi:hypothetical protein
MTARATETAGVAGVALLLALVLAASVVRAPGTRIFGRETVGRHHDPFTAMELFVSPAAADVHAQPVTDVPGVLLARAVGPVSAYNLLVVLSFPLSAAAAFLLARHLSVPAVPAAFAALAFAFSPSHLAQAAYHPHVAQTQWMPLYLLALWRAIDRPRPATLALLVAASAAVSLASFYSALIAIVITPVAVAVYWRMIAFRTAPRPLARLALTAATLVVISLAGLLYVWVAARPVLLDARAFAFPREDLARYSARAESYFLPPVANPLVGRDVQRVWTSAGVREGLLEQQVTLGWGIVMLSLVAVVAWWRQDRTVRPVAAVPVLATIAVVSLWCSLPPDYTIGRLTVPTPASVLYRFAPMFRSYARFAVVVQLMAALLAAIGAERLWQSGTRTARAVLVVLVALAGAEYAVLPAEMSRDVLPTRAHRWVADLPGDVRAFDCAALTAESQSIQWLTRDRIRLRIAAFDDCTQPNLAAKLAAFGYTHVIVRRQSFEGGWFVNEPAPDGLQPLVGFRDGQVFAITAPAPPLYTAGMTAFYPREHDARRGWRWMATEAAWTVVNSSGGQLGATLALELAAFAHPRRLRVFLDGAEVDDVDVEQQRRTYVLGPFSFSSGEHELVFRTMDAAGIANDVLNNGDRRPLSFAIGAWRWRTGEVQP